MGEAEQFRAWSAEKWISDRKIPESGGPITIEEVDKQVDMCPVEGFVRWREDEARNFAKAVGFAPANYQDFDSVKILRENSGYTIRAEIVFVLDEGKWRPLLQLFKSGNRDIEAAKQAIIDHSENPGAFELQQISKERGTEWQIIKNQ